jgi:hypothetical protein
MRLRHVVVVPSTIAFLPCYAGLEDPLRDVRHAARRAVDWLVERHPEQLSVLAADPRADNVARGASESPGERVARHLLSESGFSGQLSEAASGLLVVANGTAKRNEKAPGHLDERAAAYDKSLGTALLAGDAPTLRGLDTALGEELWAFDAPVLRELGRRAGMVSGIEPELDYADDPYGVQYWVVRWTCTS